MPSLFDRLHVLFRHRRIHDAQRKAKNLLFRGISLFAPRQRTSYSVRHISSILIVRQHNQMGDMLCSTPMFRVLRKNFPYAHITLVASPDNYAVVQHNPHLNELLLFDKIHFAKRLRAYWQFLCKLRSLKPDLAIVPATVSMSITSDVLAFFSGAKYRLGPLSLDGEANTTGFLFSMPKALDWRHDSGRHQAQRNLDILAPLGLSTEDLRPEMHSTQAELQAAHRFLRDIQGNVKVGMHPGAGKKDNRWDASKFTAVANELSRRFGAQIIITAGPMDDEVLKDMETHLEGPCHVPHEQSLGELAAIIDGLDLMITNDTGIMHVAGTTRVPLISLFGPTDPRQWAPPREGCYYLQRTDINQITVREVLGLADSLFRNKAPSTS